MRSFYRVSLCVPGGTGGLLTSSVVLLFSGTASTWRTHIRTHTHAHTHTQRKRSVSWDVNSNIECISRHSILISNKNQYSFKKHSVLRMTLGRIKIPLVV